MLEYYFSEEDGIPKVRPEEFDPGNGVVEEVHRVDNSLGQEIDQEPEGPELLGVQQIPILDGLNTLEDEESSELLCSFPDEETKSSPINVPWPFRPIRGPEEDLSELFDFMQRCDFVHPDDNFLGEFGGYSMVFDNTDQCVLILVKANVYSGILSLCFEGEVFTPRIGQLKVTWAGVIHPGHFIIVVQSPSSEVFPPCPARPRRDQEGDWTTVLEFMDKCDSEFPAWFDEGYEGDGDYSFGELE